MTRRAFLSFSGLPGLILFLIDELITAVVHVSAAAAAVVAIMATAAWELIVSDGLAAVIVKFGLWYPDVSDSMTSLQGDPRASRGQR